MSHISTDFGVDRSSRFLFTARTSKKPAKSQTQPNALSAPRFISGVQNMEKRTKKTKSRYNYALAINFFRVCNKPKIIKIGVFG